MIAVCNENGDLIRFLSKEEWRGGFHSQFGFVTESEAKERLKIRKKRGLKTPKSSPKNSPKNSNDQWLCRFEVKAKGETDFDLQVKSPAKAISLTSSQWILETGNKRFLLSTEVTGLPVSSAKEEKLSVFPGIFLSAILAGILVFSSWVSKTPESELASFEVPPPLEVAAATQVKKIIIPHVTVQAEPVKLASKVKTRGKTGGAMVDDNLGFLSLVGKKSMRDAMGGLPNHLPEVTAGAGSGGRGGSGGELLVGLGKGIRQTSVGNTGVKGLGGVGGKDGPGGGAGGYGLGMIGSGGTGNGLNGIGNGRTLASVRLSDEMVLEGGLDPAVIQATIAKYLSQVRACYERGLQNTPGLSGEVSVRFEIGPEGRLSSARVSESSLNQPQVESCITGVMLGWNFPKPLGGVNVKVNYPFILRPTGTT